MSEESPSLPIKTIVLIVTFLGLSGFLLTLIIAESPEMFIASEEYRIPKIPEQFEGIDILQYADTFNDTVAPYYGVKEFDAGGWHFSLETITSEQIILSRGNRWWLVTWGWHDLNWRNSKGIIISVDFFGYATLTMENIDRYYDPTESSSKFLAYDGIMQIDIYFSYDRDVYNSSSDALSDNALYYIIGVEWDEVNTGTSIWNIIGMLLFFSLPAIPYPLNYIIPLPLWICVITLIAIVIMRIIDLLKPLS